MPQWAWRRPCTGAPPEGHARWSLRLLADKLVEREVVEAISYESVRRTLKKCPQALAETAVGHSASAERGVCLAHGGRAGVYTRPYDPRYPQVCLDETSTQVLANTRAPLPLRPGRPERVDYEYERQGTANLFLCCEPLSGWRQTRVTERRTKVD